MSAAVLTNARRNGHGGRSLANAPVKPPAQKRAPDVGPDRVLLYLRSRFNPIRRLTPELLSVYLDRSKVGFLREIALVWDSMEDRDDKIKLAVGLRKKTVARFDYQIEMAEDLPAGLKKRAQAHKATLEYFYANLTTTRAIDENEKGGVKLLVRQMMDAVCAKYSVHEIIWKPTAEGVTAEFRWTPLWFFENLTGRLRYLTREGETYGVDLEEGGWMVTTGEGLMYALAIAYMFKSLPLRDWVTFSERNGMPAFIGKTPSQVGSPQYEAMLEAVQMIATDYAAVMNDSDAIEVLDLKGHEGELPYPPLIERMDRAIVALLRGGDLSTMSSGRGTQGHGSQRQDQEADCIQDDDVEMIDETLHQYVTRYVIEYVHGDDRPLARYKTVVPPDRATAQDLAIDQFLVTAGVPLGVDDAYKRYGRAAPRDGEELLTAPAQDEQVSPQLGNALSGDGRRLANMRSMRMPGSKPIEGLIGGLLRDLTRAEALAMKPLCEAIEGILAKPDWAFANEGAFGAEVEGIIASLPSYLRSAIADPRAQRIWENTLSAVLLNGLTSPKEK